MNTCEKDELKAGNKILPQEVDLLSSSPFIGKTGIKASGILGIDRFDTLSKEHY